MTEAGSARTPSLSPDDPTDRGAAAQDAATSPELVLLRRQLAGLDRWNAARRMQADAADVRQRSREQRLDLARRRDVLREQHRAIVARTEQHMRSSASVLHRTQRPRVVLVHRNAWFVDKITASLVESGLEVVARLSNGAEAVGAVVAEQPDLLLVEDTLPMLPGERVVREVLAYAPETVVAAQVATDAGVAAMLEAGARAAYARRVPPADVAAGIAGLVQQRRPG